MKDEIARDNPYQIPLGDLQGPVAIDTETTGLSFFDTAFVMTAAYLLPDLKVESYYFDLETTEGYDGAKFVVQNSKELVFHNAKFDIQKLQEAHLLEEEQRPVFHDTEAISHLLDEHRPKRLKYLAYHVLGLETPEDAELRKVMRELKLKKADGFYKIPREVLRPYAVKDAEYTILLYARMYPDLKSKLDLLELYQMERELTWVLLQMERDGLGVDLDYVEEMAKKYSQEALKEELKARDISGKEDFNPNSNPQVRLYFESKGIVRDKYDQHSLLEMEDPMAKTLVALRNANKMYKTYFLAMQTETASNDTGSDTPEMRGRRTGVLHPNFRQYGAVTGRMSSGKYQE